jgi:putative two-component system response regulator
MGNKKKQTILVVDDDKGTRTLLSNVLKKYNVITAENGNRALEFAGDENNMPDLILLDVIMQGMDGYEVCKQLKTNPKTKKIPVIFLTIADKPNLEVYGLDIGAVDYIKKPIYNEILMARVGTHLELKEYQDNLEFLVEERTREVRALNEEIIDTQKEIIFTLSEVMENRSEETAEHVQRVSNCIYLLARKKGLGTEEAELLKVSSPMHDIGKIGIPDEILNKRGRLTEDESDTMKSHTTIGYNILKRSNRNIMKTAAIIAHQHHERWDGNGYPRALKGDDIHIYGRITAIADAFDAMTNKRCYQKAKTKIQVIEEFKKEKGKQFDPDLTDLLIENIEEFYKIL